MTNASLISRPTGFVSGAEMPNVLERTRRVWDYRKIMRLMVVRDLKVRYAGSALGYLWTVIDPLLMSGVFYIVFVHFFHRKGLHPFLLFLITGQLAWLWIQGSISACSRALLAEASMVRSSNVPRELWVLRIILSKGVELILALPIVVLIAALYTKQPSWYAFLYPVGLLMAATLLAGLGLLLAPLVVLFRDVDRIVSILLRVLFYASPIIYSAKQIPRRYREALSWNPLDGIMVMLRSSFFPHELVWRWVIHSAIECVVILAIGVVVFSRTERQVLKEI